MVDSDVRVCSSCGVEKPLTEFWADPRKPGGRETVCRSCRSLRRAQRLGRTQIPHADAPWLRDALPDSAAWLCAQLHGEPAPGCDVALIAPEAWNQAMRLICEGTSPEAALHQAGIGEAVFRAHLRYEPRLATWYSKAKQASKRRHQPSVLEMDTVLRELIHNPGLSARSACRQHGVSYAGFILRTQTPEFEARYLRTKSVQTDRSFESMRTEMSADGLTRAARSDMARQAHALKRLEPRREWPRKPLSPAAAALKEARKRVVTARKRNR
jgi:hypothetical protein